MILLDIPQQTKDFLTMPESIYKNILYSRHYQGIGSPVVSIKETDTLLHYSQGEQFIYKTSNKYYTKFRNKSGFTLEKDTKKLRIWFGQDISKLSYLNLLFNHFNFNWFDKELFRWLTATALKNILLGKATSNTDVVKTLAKGARMSCSYSLLLQMIQSKTITKHSFNLYAKHAKDINHFIEYILNSKDNYFMQGDLLEQASLLNRKIDWKWSSKRLKEEHSKWTDDLMAIELDNIQDEQVNYTIKLPLLPKEFELLDTKRKVFQEGSSMKHCLYTNYWSSIQREEYVAYHVLNVTIGFYIRDNKLTFNQCYGYRNTQPSEDTMSFIKTSLERFQIPFKQYSVF